MIFNSLDFAIFLPIVFAIYWFFLKGKTKSQNILLLFASYIFYGWWDYRFLTLIVFSTLVDYTIGISLSKTSVQSKRKVLLWISILVNLGFLGFFKYYNFFLENFVDAFTFLGYPINSNSLNIILPVGISFYTFQTLSYTIDVYKNRLAPCKRFIEFAAFVSFFPQLVAGPIERATNLLPQFYKKRVFNSLAAREGLRQILWGLFKKVVIADNCAEYANIIFNNSAEYSGVTLFVGALMFTFQIYCDFSGYSDIAIGTSKLFGFKLMRNFAYPYFSRDIAEFWRRWHISLSTWFRDYLYIPLGGSRGGIWIKIRNTFIIFIVSGFWHGANWTFIVWGALNAIYFLPLLLTNNNRKNLDSIAQGKILPSLNEFTSILITFGFTVLAWVFFRAKDMSSAISYLTNMFTGDFSNVTIDIPIQLTLFILFLFFIEWINRERNFGISKLEKIIPFTSGRWVLYTFLVLSILFFAGEEQEFIYFQF
ncbi:MBOAT family O-acyltransferase [Mesonia ostreae]|uniref:MBOAT family O-acyltransferase n=1 Tax=Mesonia ostreae TaxID=861110 RepID=A0ABU2KH88_9FLAO|nr:MBOAT family O-acyltransferase [Mesonia ostreae]MDT0294060.1 MBOAT family O-acyltransferase [Mesonia ostreae]